MASYTQPHVLDCVARASKRAAIAMRGDLQRGVASLRIISGVAPLFGLFGTVLGMYRCFFSVGSSKSMILGMVTGAASEAMMPTILALLVAIPAFWFHQYLRGQLEEFELEMENASSDLVNSLVVYLGQLRKTDEAGWAALMRIGIRAEFSPSLSVEGPIAIAAPGLYWQRIYRHGVLELIWPRLESTSDAKRILAASMWTSFVYGFLGWLFYFGERRLIAGGIVAAFFVLGGACIRAGSVAALRTIFAFFVFASLACLAPYPSVFPAICLAIAPVLLLGSFRAARFLKSTDAVPLRRLWPLNGLLAGFGLWACVAILFGTALGYFSAGGDKSMEPAIHAGDWVVRVNAPLVGALHRGQLVELEGWDVWGAARVAGLPGDRIEVKAGKLIRNGIPVDEPYNRQSYRGKAGNFPVVGYVDGVADLERYVVPEDSLFVLNDDRNELEDSRQFGAFPTRYIKGWPVIAYSPKRGLWALPRVIH